MERSFNEGDRVRHKSTTAAPTMVVVRTEEGKVVCQWWDTHAKDFKWGDFRVFELEKMESR